MQSLNKVMIIGNLGGEPELRFTPGGKAVCSFSVAVNRQYKGKDGELVKETEWFNVIAWEKLAEQCNTLMEKGSQVYVEGRQQTRNWDGNDGAKHYKVELIAERAYLLGKKPSNGHKEEEKSEEAVPADIPF